LPFSPLIVPSVAVSCHFLAAMLPFLPPRTRNVTLPPPANRLEFSIREEDTPDTRPKSGKNGNVDHPSQLCRSQQHEEGGLFRTD
jgi:hypothetical protein